MKFSKATNYALHTMLYLVAAPNGIAVGVQSLAEIQGISPTYLSKVLTTLVKAGIIISAPGVKGGYRLSKRKEDISFLDVIHAVEGDSSMFHCSLEHESGKNDGCLIQEVMTDAENKMEQYLKEQLIVDLLDRQEEDIIEIVKKMVQ